MPQRAIFNKNSVGLRRISWGTLIVFLLNIILTAGPGFAQEAVSLPAVGSRIDLSCEYFPATLRGIKVDPASPFRFDFILDRGGFTGGKDQIKEEAAKLTRYFLAGLTVPGQDLWVNLSPYEKNRIIPDAFGLTEMGRDFLAQDYLLKQLTASLTYPESKAGMRYWDELKRNINMFEKVWIMPKKAVVYENGNCAFIIESSLKVMLKQDNKGLKVQILPLIEKEVNEGKNFAPLRQAYRSLILAAWYKRKIKESIISKTYVNQNKIGGIDRGDKSAKDKIYAQYLESFKKGAYSFRKKEYNYAFRKITQRNYFSGGVSFTDSAMDLALQTQEAGVEEINRDFKTDTPPAAVTLDLHPLGVDRDMPSAGLGSKVDQGRDRVIDAQYVGKSKHLFTMKRGKVYYFRDSDKRDFVVKYGRSKVVAKEQFAYEVARFVGVNAPWAKTVGEEAAKALNEKIDVDERKPHEEIQAALILQPLDDITVQDLRQSDTGGFEEAVVFVHLMMDIDISTVKGRNKNIIFKDIGGKTRCILFDFGTLEYDYALDDIGGEDDSITMSWAREILELDPGRLVEVLSKIKEKKVEFEKLLDKHQQDLETNGAPNLRILFDNLEERILNSLKRVSQKQGFMDGLESKQKERMQQTIDALSRHIAQQDFTKGGIDMVEDKMSLQVQGGADPARFDIDPVMLKQLEDSTGFFPEVTNIQPTSVLRFLGV